jgi:phospholipid/cholesterol/gamma-HCH transport system substrate-binding protein
MPRKTSSFLVGLFVIGSLAILVVVLIYVGATKYFEKGNLYVTYFDESVQGLTKDADVKYRGVKVGRVVDIRIAPDSRLIAVIMSIDLKDDPAKFTVAQLTVTGITGVLFINLDRKDPEAPDYSPKITFVSEYPVIASRPSDIRRIFTMVEDFAAKLKDIDAVGLAAETKQTVKDIGNLARSREIKNILANVEKTTANLAYVTGNTGKKSKEAGTLQDTLADARGVLKEAKGMVAFLTKEIEGLKLGELTGKTAHIVTELKGTTQSLRQASETLEMLLERVYERPGDLLFGKPPRKRWNE